MHFLKIQWLAAVGTLFFFRGTNMIHLHATYAKSPELLLLTVRRFLFYIGAPNGSNSGLKKCKAFSSSLR